jgi:hypothetical protein
MQLQGIGTTIRIWVSGLGVFMLGVDMVPQALSVRAHFQAILRM